MKYFRNVNSANAGGKRSSGLWLYFNFFSSQVMKSILAFVFLFSVALPGFGQQPIIDMHLHAFGFDEYGYPPPPNEITGDIPEAKTDDEVIETVLDQMHRHNIVLAVASGPLDMVLKWKRLAPAHILGGAYTGARDPLPKIPVLQALFSSDSLSILGELGLQYRGLSLADTSLISYLSLAEQMDIPVGVHTGLGDAGAPYGCCPGFRVTLGNPNLIEEVLVRHPKLRVYLMHAGYPYLQETKALLYIYPQLYVDIGVINWALPQEEFYAYLKALIVAGFDKRIMFGTDQMVWPEAIGMAVKNVKEAPFLTENQRRDIFYNNAARFLLLSKDVIVRHQSK